MEQHAEALVTLLESCLNHNLKPSQKEEDPPHAKISSDIISCMFLVSIKLHTCLLVFQLQNYLIHKLPKNYLHCFDLIEYHSS